MRVVGACNASNVSLHLKTTSKVRDGERFISGMMSSARSAVKQKSKQVYV